MSKPKFQRQGARREPAPSDNDLLWGMPAIAAEAQRDPKDLYYHASLGHLKSVRKICGRYVARRGELRSELDGREPVDAAE
jgi:hypothetical protein